MLGCTALSVFVTTSAWMSIGLLALILWRGFRSAILTKFFTFYSYIAAGLVGTAVAFCTYGRPQTYAHWYWIVEFVTLFLGCAILWEMFGRIWVPSKELSRIGRAGQRLLLVLIAGAAALFVLIEVRTPLNSAAFRLLERDCRGAQAIFFIVLVSGIFYHAIPVGKNLKAICLGYGFYVLGSLVALAIWLYVGDRVAVLCDNSQPVCFDIAAAIWLVGMWTPDRSIAMLSEREANSEERCSGSGVGFRISKTSRT